MFTLEEAMQESDFIEDRVLRAKFRFNLPKNLPPALSFSDLTIGGTPKTNFWLDSASGVHYTLIASIEPLTQDLLRIMSADKLSASKSTGASIDHFTQIPVDLSQTEHDHTKFQTSLRVRVDPFLEQSMLHRGPLVETNTKKIPGESFFSESKAVALTVNIDQYVIVIGNAFPILLSVENGSSREIEKLVPCLISKVSFGDKTANFEYIACTGQEMDLSVAPGDNVEDAMYWFKISPDVRIPSSYHTSLFKVSYEILIKAHLSGGHSIEVKPALPFIYC
jgi:hypothetical protein